MKKRITLRAIAREAGVSHATVSYVLSGKGGLEAIPAQTQERVRTVAKEMGWHPDYVLSALSTGRTRLVGLWQSFFTETYQANIANSMEKLLREDGYAVLLSPAYKKTDPTKVRSTEEIFDLGMFKKWSVDGIIGLDGPEHICYFLRKHPLWRVPIVSMGSYALTNDPMVDSVMVDVLKATHEGLERWAKAGRKRIAMLSAGYVDADPRVQLYLRFVRERGMDSELIRFDKGDSQRDNAEKVLTSHVASFGCPDAVFCRSDEMAMGAYRALRRMGYRIPDDVALLGIDGIRDLDYLEYPVSTVVQPVQEMCRVAWELLQDRLEEPNKPARHVILSGTLDWRE